MDVTPPSAASQSAITSKTVAVCQIISLLTICRRPGRYHLYQRLQRPHPGRHRHDADDDSQWPADEHRRLLSRSRAQPTEPDIQANALTECLLLEGKRCVGVRYTVDGQQREARATARSSSAPARSIRRSCWNCPASASRTGCKALGIEVRHELKGVGENLRDHYSPRMKWSVPASLGMTYNDKMRGLGKVKQALKYALTHKGLLGLPAAPIRAYIRTRAGLDAPDAAISWVPFFMTNDFQLAKKSGVTAIMNILRSESTGSIHIASKSPQHTAGGAVQLPDRAARPRGHAGGDAYHAANHDRAGRCRGHRQRRDRARREHPV